MEEIKKCDNCIVLKKKFKQRTVFISLIMIILVVVTTLFGVIVPFLRDLGKIPGGRYQIAYSISPDNSNYAMNVYAINTKYNQYEIHADFVIGASVATAIKMERPATLGTTSSLGDAVMACNTVKWLNDRVIVTPGLKGKEYSLPKTIYTQHR